MPRWTEADRTPLASLRANAYLSRNEAAVRLHVGVTTLARYENGANDVPMGVAEKMAILYQVPFDAIREAVARTQNTVEVDAAVSAAKGEEG
nr:helix-turn-helix transcriptional regulator [uncultured Fretibacterium sp.]